MRLSSLLALGLGLGLFGATAEVNAQNATVRVVHGIDGRDLSAAQSLPVDVSVNGSVLLPGFQFGDVAGPLSLPADTYLIEISLASTNDAAAPSAPVISANVPIGAGENVTLIAHLDENGNPTASKFVNDMSRQRFLRSRTILQHTAWAPAVDIDIARRFFSFFGSTTVEDVTNGAQATLDTFFGWFNVSVLAANTSTTVLGPLQISAFPGRINSYFVVGSLTNGTLGVIAVRLR